MRQPRYTETQIRAKLKEAETLLFGGAHVDAICRRFAVSRSTYYKWMRAYGGMAVERVRQVKALQKEQGERAAKQSRHTEEHIRAKLKEAEKLVFRGATLATICRKLAVSKPTYYQWRKEYGGMDAEQIRQIRELHKENSQLRRIVADLRLEKTFLEKMASRRFFRDES